MAPENDAKRENPIKLTNESLVVGKELFVELCSSCHGLNGTGLKHQETGLSKDTPHLPTRLSTHSDGDFHWKIKNGKGEMPSFSDELTDTEVWHIINFLKAK
jgi:mono/diheme cytochrome c family protein